jgi:hypothetical protein
MAKKCERGGELANALYRSAPRRVERPDGLKNLHPEYFMALVRQSR